MKRSTLPWSAALLCLLALHQPAPCSAGPSPWIGDFGLNIGGHVRTTATVQDDARGQLLPNEAGDTSADLTLETRLKGSLSLGPGLELTTHYQAWLETGDQTRQDIRRASSPGPLQSIVPRPADGDELRFMDLTRTVSRSSETRVTHRLDRLKLTLSRPWGRLSLGRQALTLGNGLIFNPMDLFNPFSPTAFLRDYKTGDDMAVLQVAPDSGGDIRFFHLPRRDPEGREISWNQSSTGLAGQFFIGSTGISLMAARHFKDRVVGLGLSGSLAAAAWRADLTWTDVDRSSLETDFFSAVANLDRSWVWGGKNWYGLVEFFFSGIGESEPSQILSSAELLERISRGELFVLGRSYLAGMVRFEAHPLVNISTTMIANLEDESWLFQPKVTWSLAQNLDLLLGATLASGPDQSEFGGYDVRLGLQEISISRPSTVTLWLTAYF